VDRRTVILQDMPALRRLVQPKSEEPRTPGLRPVRIASRAPGRLQLGTARVPQLAFA